MPIASALYDYSGDSNISETLRQGATFKVVDSATTIRSGETTYAYQLSSGDWVMAYNTSVVGEYEQPALTGITVTPQEDGELLTFEGVGAPAVYDERVLNTLTVKLYDVDSSTFNGDAVVGELVEGVGTQIDENGVTVLTFDLSGDNIVWGHTVEYNDGKLTIFLQRAPQQNTTLGKPLDGFVIMVDAGHGGEDTGAPGMASGQGGPTEKELNLNLANVLKIRLEQLGAQVIMTRTDDATLSLQERLLANVSARPHFFISVHYNSLALTSNGGEAQGVECYYFEQDSAAFAQALVDNVAEYTGRENRGAKDGYFYVTRATGAQSVLFEYGFVINPTEYETLYTQKGVYDAAYGTAQGFIQAVEGFYKEFGGLPQV